MSHFRGGRNGDTTPSGKQRLDDRPAPLWWVRRKMEPFAGGTPKPGRMRDGRLVLTRVAS